MDRTQMLTILYLVFSMLLFLAAVLTENPLFAPAGLLFLVMGGTNSQKRNEKASDKTITHLVFLKNGMRYFIRIL